MSKNIDKEIYEYEYSNQGTENLEKDIWIKSSDKERRIEGQAE